MSDCRCGAEDCGRCRPEEQAAVECSTCGRVVKKCYAVQCTDKRCDAWQCMECVVERGSLCQLCEMENEVSEGLEAEPCLVEEEGSGCAAVAVWILIVAVVLVVVFVSVTRKVEVEKRTRINLHEIEVTG